MSMQGGRWAKKSKFCQGSLWMTPKLQKIQCTRIGARWNTPKSALANCQLEPSEILWNDCTTDSALSKMKAGIRQLLLWCDFWTNLTIWVGEKTWKMLEALLWCRFHQEIWCSLCLSNEGSSHLLTQQFHSWKKTKKKPLVFAKKIIQITFW